MRTIVIFALLLLSTSFLQAQRGQRPNPKQMAERQTTWMTDMLSLNDEQRKEIHQINLEFVQKQLKLRDALIQDQEIQKEKMLEIRDERLEALEKVLTKEQLAKFKEKARGHRSNQEKEAKEKQ